MCSRTKTAIRASIKLPKSCQLLISLETLLEYSMALFTYDSDSRTNTDLHSLRLHLM